MKNLSAGIWIPGVFALVGILALVSWASVGPMVGHLDARVPGLDRPKTIDGELPAKPLVGTVSTFDGHPADLPGTWPRFRGERFDNIAIPTVPLARQWPSSGLNKLWSIDLGEGYAGPAVWGGRVFVLDYDRAASADALRCFSLADGKEIWRFSYPVVVKRNHGMSRTVPAVTDKYVVALGPKCHVCCVDPATGKAYWLIDLVKQFGAKVPEWYAGQCPLIDGERAILAPGGESLLVALDCKTGEVVWKSPNPQGWTMTHASIMPMEFAGKRMYVYCGKGGVAGVSADDGAILWETTEWKIAIATAPSPVILPEGRIFFSGGYESGAMMMQLREEGGNISVKKEFKLKPSAFGSEQQTPIWFDGYLYGVRKSDRQLVCLDPRGKIVWSSGSQHRFGSGPYLIADGLIYVLDDFGKLTLAVASPKGYEPLSTTDAIPDGHDSWGPMALVGGRLILRDLTRMICLDVAEK
jgi:outer membrane protein assembly factor BamB